jgi:protein O-mannosyl-transferase
MFPDGKYKPVTFAVLSLVVILLYFNTLSGGFVWDDNLFAANQVYWRFDVRKILFSLANGLEYQPVRDFSFLFDIFVLRGSPFGFHLTNLLLFTVIVLLVYRLAEKLADLCSTEGRELRGGNLVPLLTALLFALHPLRSEVVAWITQRNTLLATLFSLVALVLFFRHLDGKGGKRLLVVSVIAYILALFSKATVVVLPLLLLFLIMMRRTRRPAAGWLILSPYFIAAALAAGLHISIARKTNVLGAAIIGGGWWERLAVALQIPWFYLRKLFFPTGMSVFYSVKFSTSLISPAIIPSIVVLFVTIGGGWVYRRRFPEIWLGLGWFYIMIIPVSNVFNTNPTVADRYIFLPSIGISFMVAALAGRLFAMGRARIIVGAAVVPMLVILALQTFRQNRYWHDDISLWSVTSARSPGVAGVWFNLGRAWHRTPRLGMALDAYLKSLSLDPCGIESLENAAALFSSSQGSLDYRKELVGELTAQLPPAPAGLALIGHKDIPWPHPDAAEALFLKLLDLDPDSVELQLALANLYFKVGAPDRAAYIYNEIVRLGNGRGEAEFGLARIAIAGGARQESARLAAIARQKGGVPEQLLRMLEDK